jgi:hypothetical protein
MSQTNVYIKEFLNRQEAMAFKYTEKRKIHIYEGRYMYLSIDPDFNGELLPLESLDTSLLVESDLDPRHCKLYRFMDTTMTSETEAPRGHNYVLGLNTKLFPVRTFIKGELQSTYWYGDEAHKDLVLKVEVIYTRDQLGFATRRITTRTWLREDGTEHEDKKLSIKTYDSLAQIKEGIKRRGNIVDGLQIPVLGLMMQVVDNMTSSEILILGREFLKQHQTSFIAFVNESNHSVIYDMLDAQDEWLDIEVFPGLTIRGYILNELNIYGISL